MFLWRGDWTHSFQLIAWYAEQQGDHYTHRAACKHNRRLAQPWVMGYTRLGSSGKHRTWGFKCAWTDLMLSRCLADRAWIGLPKPSLTRADALPRLLMELSPLADSNPSHPFMYQLLLYQLIKLSSRSSWGLFISAASWHVRKSMCHLSHPVSPTEPARGAVEVKHVETLAYSILQPYLLNFSPKTHRANVGLVLRCREANANRPMHSRQKSCQKWKASF